MTEKTFAEVRAEDRRLSLLLILAESEGYEANAYLLQQLLEVYGHSCSIDRVRGDLAWLEEQTLVSVSSPGDVAIGRATARGLDCAKGRAEVPGVKRPAP